MRTLPPNTVDARLANRDAANDAAEALERLRDLLARFADALPMAQEPGDERDQRYCEVWAMWDAVGVVADDVRRLAWRFQWGM